MKQIKQYISDSRDNIKAIENLEFLKDTDREANILNVFPEVEYQNVLGFGGAFTEAAAYCYSTLTEEEKERLLRAYFSKEGLAYNFCRTHINSCDFSLDRYVYVEENDIELKSFTLARDKKYIIPFIKDALKYTGEELMLFCSPWSAPAWMKTNNSVISGGAIKPEYLGVWANYYCKYISALAEEGIKISALTVQNEPKAKQTWESCEFTALEEGVFVRDYLAPALKENGLGHIKIIIWDHNKERVYDRARDTFAVSGVRELVWGIGFHWYSGTHFDAVAMANKMFPEKMLIETEYCKTLDAVTEAFGFGDDPLAYATEMLGNFNSGMNASVDWNMLLDLEGGPYHDRTYGGCKAPVMVDTQRGTFTLNELYYNLYHFAHFIKRGAVRIGASSFDDSVLVTAFKNPDGELILVALNKCEDAKTGYIRVGEATAKAELSANSLSTFVIR